MKKINKAIIILVVLGFLLPMFSNLTEAAGNTYRVQPGDSLWKIANKFNTTISTLRQLNNLWTNYLHVGQVLKVPGQAKYYTVVWGDSLWKISKKTGVSTTAIKQANNLTSNYIVVGQRLIIPTNNWPAKPNYNFSQSELDLFARVIYAEARGEPYLGKVAVAAVILNRLRSSQFPNTLNGVIYQKYAFESVSSGYIWRIYPDKSVYQAAQEAINGSDPSNGALYFYNPQKVSNSNNWIWSRKVITRIGDHVFAI